MRLFTLFIALFCFQGGAKPDPASCASAARLLAQQKALINGNGPSDEFPWDSLPPEISVSSNGGMVHLESVASDPSGQRLDTTVVFLRRPDGRWAAHRTVKRGDQTVDSESWIQDLIPLTRATLSEYRWESGPLTNASLPVSLAAYQKLHGIADADVEKAYRELRSKALSGTSPRWIPKEGVVSAVELAFVRLGTGKLESVIQKGAQAFEYQPKDVEAHLRGTASPKRTVSHQEQSDYVQLMGALRSLERRGFALEVSQIRASLLERLSQGGSPPAPSP